MNRLLILCTFFFFYTCNLVQKQYKITYYKYGKEIITRIDIRNSPYDTPCLTEFYYGKIEEREIPYFEIKYCGRDGFFSCYLEFTDSTTNIYSDSNLNERGVPDSSFQKKDLYSEDFFLYRSQFKEYEDWKKSCNVVWVYPLSEKFVKGEKCVAIESKDWQDL